MIKAEFWDFRDNATASARFRTLKECHGFLAERAKAFCDKDATLTDAEKRKAFNDLADSFRNKDVYGSSYIEGAKDGKVAKCLWYAF